MGETSTNDVATQSLQASFGDTSSNAVCTKLIQVQSSKAKSNDHYRMEPACRAVGQSSQSNQAFCVGARRCGRVAHRLARVKQPRKATKIFQKSIQHRAGTAQHRPRYPLEPPRTPHRRPRSASQCPRVAPGEAQAPTGRGPVLPGTPIESPRGGRKRAEATNFAAKLPPE